MARSASSDTDHKATRVFVLLVWAFMAFTLGGTLAGKAQAQDIDWIVNLNDLGSDPTPAGGLVVYNATIANAGSDPAPGQTYTLDIPAGTTLETITGFAGCPALPIAGPATPTCTLPPLAPDADVTGTFGLRTPALGSVTFGVNVATGGDVLPGNNSANQTTTIIAGANLRQTVTGPATAVAGSTVTYTLTTTNLGPSTASGMIVDFPIPTGLGAIVQPAGCTLSGATYLCTVPGPLTSGATHDFVFQAQIQSAAGSTITPLVGVTPGTPADPIAANNTGTMNTTVTAGSDLYMTKTRLPVAGILVGDTVTFTLTPRYTGDNPTTITVTDTIPTRYTPVSASGTGWSCSIAGQTLTCTRPAGTGAGNDVALPAITLQTTAASAGAATNTASVTAAGPVDPNPANNSANDGGATVANPTVDLRANKSGPNPPLVVVGNSYTFRLSTTNIGTAGFFGTVVLTDALPSGYTVTGVTGSGWSCSPATPLVGPATLTCSRVYTAGARLAPGATTPDVVVTALATATGTRTNTLTVSSPDGNLPDLNGPNNTTSVSTTGSTGPNAADVSVTKTAGLSTLVVGDAQSFTIEVRNTGPITATNVTVSDDLLGLMNNLQGPTGAGTIGQTTTPGVASGMTCSTSALSATSRQLTCSIASLPICTPGVDCPTITVNVRPGGNGGTRTNTVTAFSQNVADPVLPNNSAQTTYTVTPRVDITVDKVASPSPAVAGQNLTYVVTARNLANGLSAADNVTIVDTLPANVTFVSATPSAGSCAVQPIVGTTTNGTNTVECNLGSIDNGAQRTVTIVVRPNSVTRGTTITNNVAVSTTTPEVVTGNNTASVATPVQNPSLDLIVNKLDSIDPVAIGDDTVYTIVARNNGPSAAENIVITDTLPADRIRFRSSTVSGGGTCSAVPVDSFGGTLTCSWTSIPAGEQRTVTVTMRGTTKGVATNLVTITSDEAIAGFETNVGNNTAVQTTTVRTRADMEVVSKTPSANPVNLRETFTYTIRLRNNTGTGLAEADDVIVTDPLPTGMALTGTPSVSVVSGSASLSTCTGTAGATTFTCSLGTVASGSVVDIVAPVQILTVTSYPQTFTNTATVSTSSLDVASANNSNSSSMTINSSSIAGRLFRDFDNDTTVDATDTGISGITMTLTGTAFDGTSITRTATTDTNGNYTFPFIPQGTYAVAVGTIAEQHLTNGTGTIGSNGGTLANPSSTTGITLPANTAATGYLFARVPTARLGLAKNVQGAITVLADGSVRLTVRHTLRNYSLEPLINVGVTDPLSGATPNRFGTFTNPATPATDPLTPGQYTVYNRSTTCGAGTLNASFDGSANTQLLSGVTRPIGTASCTVDFILRYQPPAPLPTPVSGNRWQNQSTMTGQGQWSGQTSGTNPQLTDLSHSGTNPDVDNDGIANETSDNTPTPVAPTLTPQVRLVKTANTGALSNPVVAGNVVTYSFAVTNTGNMALTNVVVNDPLIGGGIPGSPIASIAPGQTVTLTAPYTLTAANLSARQVTNQATVTATHTLNSSGVPQTVSDLSGTATTNDTPTVVSLGDIRLIKTVITTGLSSPVAVGNTLTYRFEVRNTGSSTLTNVTVTDPLPGLVLSGSPIASLAPGAIDTTSITGTYTITQADIDAGRITNSAAVAGRYGTDGSGNPLLVTDTSGTAANNDTPLATTVPQAPSVALVKTVDTSGLSSPPAVGNVLTYAFTVTNTGNTTLTNVTLADPLPGMVLTAPAIASLAPGASSSTWTGTYTLTQADINTGRVTNQATATGGYVDPVLGPRTVSDLSGTSTSDNTPTTTGSLQVPSLALVKTVNTSGVTSPTAVGNTLTYTFAVTNTGNTTLTNVTLADPLPGMTLNAPAIASLAPGATSATWTGTYTLTQADINTGRVTNQATATGRYVDPVTGAQTVSDPSGTATGNNTPTTAPIPQNPAIALVKTINTSGLSSPPAVGNILTYTFAVTNTGNVDLANVTLSDPLPGMTLTAPTIASLAPGATSSTWTGSYTLTQADIDNGFVENQATATGSYTDPVTGAQTVSDLSGTATGNNTATTSGNLQVPSVALVKTVDTSALSSPVAVGDELTYAFTVTNTGNTTLTNVTLADPLPGMVLTAPAIASLAPGASSSTWTGTYTLTQADIDNGFVENQATATGGYTDPVTGAQTVSDLSGTTAGNNTPTTSGNLQTPSVALVKTVDTSALSSPVEVGDTLGYAFTVTNTGNTTLTNVTLADPLPGMVLTAPAIASLAPGASSSTWTGTYALTQADIDNGFVENQATATGGYTDPVTGAQTVSDLSGTTAGNNTPTTSGNLQTPSVALVKTVDTSALSSPVAVGDELTYAFTVTNTGNTTLTNVTLADPLPGVVLTAPAIASLAPGASSSTWTGTYTLTQADIDNGTVENQATATGGYTDPVTGPQTVDDLSGATTGDDVPTTAAVAQDPSVALVKTVDTSGLSSPVAVGDELTYAFTVTNTGNTTLTNVTLADPLPGMALTAPAIASLAPGATSSTWTGTYTLTQADIDNGTVENQATATGSYTDPVTGPQTVDDLSGATTGDDDPTIADGFQTAAIALVKTVDTSGLSSPVSIGDELAYAFTVTNTGNTTLTNVTLADPLPGMALTAPAIASLAPGATSSTWTGTYTLTQADIDNGTVENQATVTGGYTDPVTGPQTVDDLSGATTGDDVPTEAAIAQDPSVALVKTVDTSGLSSPVAVGDTLSYAFTVTNTGNTTLTGVTLADPLPGMVLTAPAIASLAPGASSSTWTGTYALTQADIDNGFVENQATATGGYTDPVTGPQTVDDLSGATTGDDDPTTAAVAQDPSVALVKTVDTSGLSSPVAVGDELTYAFTVTNTGNTTLTNVTLADPLPGVVLTAPAIASLAPGATSSTWTGTYTLTQADIDNGFVENQATATGSYVDPVTGPQTVDDLSGVTSGDDDPTMASIPQTPSVALLKTADTSGLSSPAEVGETISYGFAVTNTGNTTLTNVTLTDPLPGMTLTAPAIASLAPGDTATTWTGTYTLTQADIDDGFVENQATATGTYTDPVTGPQTVDDLSGTATTNDTPTLASLGQNGSLALIKTADTSGVSTPAQVGETIAYSFDVRNTGNVTLTGVTLSDPLPGMTLTAPTIATLAPGATASVWTGTYAITQADIDDGFVENQATATGSYTDPVTGPQSVDDLSGATFVDDVPSTALLPQDPELALVKTVDTSGLSSPVSIGDELAYAFTVTNTGNTTLTNVTLADPLPGMTLTAPAIASLAPGASSSTWTGVYTLTQADIDNGTVENQATATGAYVDPVTGPQTVDDLSGATTGDDDPTTATIAQAPAVALVKTVDTSGLSSPVAVGDELAYAFTVTNTGNTTLTNVTLADPLPGMVLTAPAIASLAPGASSSTWTGTYALTQADINNGFVENQATATGGYTDPVTGPQTVDDLSGATTGDDDPTIADGFQTAAIALVKTVDTSGLSSPVAVGDELTYAFTVTNTGNTTLTNVTLADPLPGMVLTAPAIASLAPGASSSTWTGTYALTQADIDNGFVENQATATGSYIDPVTGPQAVDDLSGATTGDDDPTTATIAQAPAVALVKTVDTSGLSSPVAVGDELAYAFTVTNTGNVTLTGVTLADPLPGMVLTAPAIASLAPGASSSTWTGVYTLTQADIDNGFVENQATATGAYTDPVTGPQTVDDLSGTTATNDTPTTAPFAQTPSIALVKTVDTSALSSPVAVGDTLSYAFTVTNTGNVTLTGVTLADPLPGMTLTAPAIASLAPGASSSIWTATYTLTQADIDNGFVENQATATGTYTDPVTGPQTVDDLSGTTTTNDTPTTAPFAQTPSIALVKTVDTSGLSSPVAVGDELTYAFTVTNTGNTTLTNVTLADPLPGMVLTAPAIASLAPGASSSTWTGTYALTQADMDNGFVENQATATGTYTDPVTGPQTVDDLSGTTTTNDTPTTAPLGQSPGVVLVKTADTSGVSNPAVVGDTVRYTFVATNVGNVTLDTTTLSDPMVGLTLDATTFGTLAPGQTSAPIEGTYALTQADIDAGFVENTATVEGTYTDGAGADASVTDTSGTDGTLDAPTRVDLEQNAGISLIKRAFVDRPGGISEIGDTIRYTFEIRNTGNVTLTTVELADDLPGIVITGGPITDLDPGEVDTDTYTAVYAVTAEDFARAEVVNQATATGTYQTAGGANAVVSAASGTEASNTNPTVVGIGLPDITLDIDVASITDTNGNGRTDAGDGIVYRFTVTNNGNVPLTGVNLVPGSLSLNMPGLVCTAVDLAVGASAELVCVGNTYTITPDDVRAGTVELTADAQGTSPGGIVVADTSAAVAVPVSALPTGAPTLEATKTVSQEQVRVGESVLWTITITHPDAGGLPVDASIVDMLPAGLALDKGSARLNGDRVKVQITDGRIVFPARTIQPGGTLQATLRTTVLGSEAPGDLRNTAWAEGGGQRLSNIAEAVVSIVAEPVFACGTVVGRVFVDANHDGAFNAAGETTETGLGGIRLVAPNGVSVTTDKYGRYNLPCESLPSNIGSNFQLKLDPRTLPTGLSMTTENPRVVRLTAGMVTRLDFGVAASRPVHIDLDARAFPQGQARPELVEAFAELAGSIAQTPSVVRIVYTMQPGETERMARRNLRAAEKALRAQWNGAYALRIETRLVQ